MHKSGLAGGHAIGDKIDIVEANTKAPSAEQTGILNRLCNRNDNRHQQGDRDNVDINCVITQVRIKK